MRISLLLCHISKWIYPVYLHMIQFSQRNTNKGLKLITFVPQQFRSFRVLSWNHQGKERTKPFTNSYSRKWGEIERNAAFEHDYPSSSPQKAAYLSHTRYCTVFGESSGMMTSIRLRANRKCYKFVPNLFSDGIYWTVSVIKHKKFKEGLCSLSADWKFTTVW